jgi:hypothetical protein
MHCTYCATSIRQPGWSSFLPGEQGFRYGDGRIICRNCHQTAVKNEAQIQAVLRHVKRCFAELGLSIHWDRLPIRLLHQPQMQQSGGSANTVGYAESIIMGRHVDSRVTMLYGMPAALAVETLAHEAGHVWCREHNIQFIPDPEDEEGVCNVLACLALRRLGLQYDAPTRIEAMFKNPDPVYGAKFRAQWNSLSHLGWQPYKSNLLR